MEELPVIPANFGIKLIDNDGVRKQFSLIEKLVQNCTEVINCGDAGQEGELIQRWVLLKAKCKVPIKQFNNIIVKSKVSFQKASRNSKWKAKVQFKLLIK